MKVGLGISEDLGIVAQQDLARAAEATGLHSLWTNEATGRDALLVCQAWAAATTRLQVGVAVLPIWSRSAAQVAMGAATLQEASGGRFHLGLGVSHPGTMTPWHGAAFRRPLTAAGEYLGILGQLFAGASSDVDGEVVSSQRFRLGISPLPSPPTIHLGAMGPRMLELAGEAADGAFLNWSGPQEVARATTSLRARNASALTTTYVRMAVDPDRAAARAALADQFGRYAALPAYAAHFERQGLGDAVQAVKQGHRDGVPATDAVSDDDLRVVGWWGTPNDDPSETVADFAATGLSELVARLVVVGPDPSVSAAHLLRALAPTLDGLNASG